LIDHGVDPTAKKSGVLVIGVMQFLPEFDDYLIIFWEFMQAILTDYLFICKWLGCF